VCFLFLCFVGVRGQFCIVVVFCVGVFFVLGLFCVGSDWFRLGCFLSSCFLLGVSFYFVISSCLLVPVVLWSGYQTMGTMGLWGYHLSWF